MAGDNRDRVAGEIQLIRLELDSLEKLLNELAEALALEEDLEPELRETLEKRRVEIAQGKVKLATLEEGVKKGSGEGSKRKAKVRRKEK